MWAQVLSATQPHWQGTRGLRFGLSLLSAFVYIDIRSDNEEVEDRDIGQTAPCIPMS
jgi:hypothetical protein